MKYIVHLDAVVLHYASLFCHFEIMINTRQVKRKLPDNVINGGITSYLMYGHTQPYKWHQNKRTEHAKQPNVITCI